MQQHVESGDQTRNALAETLFYRHAPAIFAFLRQQSSSREDAEDILLEVFAAVLEKKHLDNLSLSQQQSLLWTIARNKLIDMYRRHVRRPSIPMEQVLEEMFAEMELAPEHEILRREEYTRLHVLIQSLSPLQQMVLRLRFVNELRSPQIALRVGKSETAVRTILSRTLNQLRELYREGEN